MQDLTVDNGAQKASAGSDSGRVFVYFHTANLSWHMTPDEARALGGALIHEAFLIRIRPMEPPPEMRVPADG